MITIQTKEGPKEVPTVWKGQTLSVHRPLLNGGPSKAPRHWALTHNPTGLSLSTLRDVAKADAVALAKRWDNAAALIDPDNPKAWPQLQSFRDDLGRVGSAPLRGPVTLTPLQKLEAATTPAEITAEPFPASETVPADRLRTGKDGPEILWRGRWWPVPSLGEVEAWALDSLAETPDGRTVEPDHPESWPVILGVC